MKQASRFARGLAGLSLCAILGGPPVAGATWQPVPLYGGQILSLASVPSQPETVYAGVAPFGIEKSTDGGRTWASPGPEAAAMTAYRLEISADEPRLLFAEFGSTAKFFGRSRDSGVSWELLQVGDEIFLGSGTALTLDPHRPRALFAATDHGVYQSADAGDHWAPFALSDLHAQAVGVHPGKPNLLFAIGLDAATESVLLRSRDGGASWQECASFSGIAWQPRFAFAPDGQAYLISDSGLFRSDDDGATWIEVSRKLSTPIKDFALTPTGVLLVSTPTGVLRSRDGGETWLPEADGQGVRRGGPDETVSALAPLAGARGADGAILSGSARGIWRSGSIGAGWRASSQGILAHSIGAVAASSGAVPRVLTLTPEAFASADSGATWKRTENGLGRVSRFRMDHLAFDPNDGKRAYADGAAGLYLSRDGGFTWQLLLPGYSDYPYFLSSYHSSVAIDPQNPKRLYLSSGSKIRFESGRSVTFAYSRNGGRSWKARRYPLEAQALAVDPHHGNTLFATTRATLLKSLDAGTTWRRAGDARRPSALALDPKRADALWVGQPDGTVTWSTDGGKIFRPLGSPLGGRVATLVPDPERADGVYAGVVRKGIYRWDAGVAAWLPMGEGLPVDRYRGAFALDAGRRILWAGTEGAGLLRLDLE